MLARFGYPPGRTGLANSSLRKSGRAKEWRSPPGSTNGRMSLVWRSAKIGFGRPCGKGVKVITTLDTL